MPTVLPDCCEDWILQYGAFYLPEEGFACPECATGWRKVRTGVFARADSGQRFRRRDRVGDGQAFPYLAAESGEDPLVERCCAGILIRYGATLAAGEFRCPVCRTDWTKSTGQRGGMRFAQFEKAGLPEPYTVQRGRTRSFMVPVSAYSPPRE
jgi:hypothetical protein